MTTALFVAAVGLLALGVATITRHSAAAIGSVIALVVLPLLVASALPTGAARLLMQLTPAGGFATQRAKPPTVALVDPSAMISPWWGLTVACLYAAAALAVAWWTAAAARHVIRSLHAEWTKTRTLPSTLWLLAASALGAAFGRTGVQIGQVAIVVLAVQVIGNEYGTGLIRPTLTAIPNRALVFAGKLTVVAAGAALTGGTHAPYLTLIAIYSLGTATVIRDSAGAGGHRAGHALRTAAAGPPGRRSGLAPSADRVRPDDRQPRRAGRIRRRGRPGRPVVPPVPRRLRSPPGCRRLVGCAHLDGFYRGCGFRTTAAGLMRLA